MLANDDKIAISTADHSALPEPSSVGSQADSATPPHPEMPAAAAAALHQTACLQMTTRSLSALQIIVRCQNPLLWAARLMPPHHQIQKRQQQRQCIRLPTTTLLAALQHCRT
jgi:hypothetical protein